MNNTQPNVPDDGGLWGKITDTLSRAFSGAKKGVGDMMKNAPAYAKAPLGVAMAITVGPFVEVLGAYAVTHPLETIGGLEIANDVFNDSMPPVTPHGTAIDFVIKGYEHVNHE